jgi:hypothetical protein
MSNSKAEIETALNHAFTTMADLYTESKKFGQLIADRTNTTATITCFSTATFAEHGSRLISVRCQPRHQNGYELTGPVILIVSCSTRTPWNLMACLAITQ